jgi:hypothetical protein
VIHISLFKKLRETIKAFGLSIYIHKVEIYSKAAFQYNSTFEKLA